MPPLHTKQINKIATFLFLLIYKTWEGEAPVFQGIMCKAVVLTFISGKLLQCSAYGHRIKKKKKIPHTHCTLLSMTTEASNKSVSEHLGTMVPATAYWSHLFICLFVVFTWRHGNTHMHISSVSCNISTAFKALHSLWNWLPAVACYGSAEYPRLPSDCLPLLSGGQYSDCPLMWPSLVPEESWHLWGPVSHRGDTLFHFNTFSTSYIVFMPA